VLDEAQQTEIEKVPVDGYDPRGGRRLEVLRRNRACSERVATHQQRQGEVRDRYAVDDVVPVEGHVHVDRLDRAPL
jgi:hypothetical protein